MEQSSDIKGSQSNVDGMQQSRDSKLSERSENSAEKQKVCS
jgi:hypothetical protein